MKKTDQLIETLQEKLQPKVAYAANHNMTPNHFYISIMLLSVVAGVAVTAGSTLYWPMLLVCVILGIRVICSNIALLLICEHRMTSHLNIFLSELHAAVSDLLIFLPFAFIPDISAPLVIATVCVGLLSQMASIVAVPIIKARRDDGPINSLDRIIIFGVIALLVGVGVPAFLWANLVLLVLFILEGITLINRIRRALKIAG